MPHRHAASTAHTTHSSGENLQPPNADPPLTFAAASESRTAAVDAATSASLSAAVERTVEGKTTAAK